MTQAPFGHAATGANRHDRKLLSATMEGIVIARPELTEEQLQHLYLDAGYEYETTRQSVVDHQYLPHIRSRGQEQQDKARDPGYRGRRWINRSRRLLVRWEKKGENYLAFLHLACAQLIFAKIAVFR